MSKIPAMRGSRSIRTQDYKDKSKTPRIQIDKSANSTKQKSRGTVVKYANTAGKVPNKKG